MEVELNPGERVDSLNCGGFSVIQNPEHFCFGVDAVCLAEFASAKKNERVLDLCTGSGVIPILMCAKGGGIFTGLELQEACADMARRSVAMNGLSGRIKIDSGNLIDSHVFYGTDSFDVITVNPPYMNEGGGHVSEADCKAVARHEITCNIKDVCSVSAKLLVFGGRLYMVHRPHRLADVFCALRSAKLEPKRIQFVQGHEKKPPALVLIEASYGGRPMLSVLPVKILSHIN
ncbi:MAG: methyltransferase [Defluviitaleaceae bacterium]|nr:methyltransferase [Defluviitaleaceae bacterium]